MGAAYLAMGIFTSGLTPNQIVAFITGFALIFVFYMLDKVIVFFPGAVASILEYASVTYHFDNLARGVIDTRDLVYYGTVIVLFLFLAVRSLEARKWR